MPENQMPTLTDVRCSPCGLVFQEMAPTDHPLAGTCPRCGATETEAEENYPI